MRISPSLTADGPGATMVKPDEMALLRQEIARLRRRNRALALALAEMERVAERDMLTSLYNRRYFLSALHRCIARANGRGAGCVLIYVDVNGLKAINDRLGHAAGDFALIQIAHRLSESLRPGDTLARIGGDEFGLLLDRADTAAAYDELERIATAISGEVCRFRDTDIPLSVACGSAPITPGLSAEDLLGRADAAMYRAKRGG